MCERTRRPVSRWAAAATWSYCHGHYVGSVLSWKDTRATWESLPRRDARMHGANTARKAVAELIGGARAGRGGALLVRAEPGLGA
ncbi:hypothetical protein LUW77_09745 [Streptomyces radiopugnans]|nr:hypothetical protein LUW77_09745 [Streptomyces radiopugnans]